jgi:hypothetical protein
LVFDTIARIGLPQWSWRLTNDELFDAWRKLSGVDRDPMASYPGGSTVLDAYRRTLCLDKSVHDMGLNSKTFRDPTGDRDFYEHDRWRFRQMLALQNLPDPDGESVSTLREKSFIEHILRCTLNRAFFVSSRGYFGLAPAGAVVKDKIYVLAGGRPLYVLRDTQQTTLASDGGSVPAFMLLGDCYVQGVMHGEAVREVDEGTRQFERMVLL